MNIDPRYAGIRSLIETPIMNERKWAKVPELTADAFLIDLEDSVPPPLKEKARGKVLEYLRQPEYFGGRLMVARANHLSTPWGRNDLEALGEAGVGCLAYPKCETAEDVIEVQEILRAKGADPDIFAAIETARSVLELPRIAALDKVVSLGLGAGDLSADMGVPLYRPDGELNELFHLPRTQVTLTAAAYGKLAIDMAWAPDLRDLDELRRRLVVSRRLGFTTAATFYPPHVAVINEVFSPSSAELDAADEVVGIYEAAVAAGNNAVTVESGRTILVHDYQKALRVRARFEAIRA